MLDGTETEQLAFLRGLSLTPTRSWWHYSRFLVAEVNGSPASALSAFRGAEAYPLSQQAMAEVASELGWGDAEQQAMWTRGSYIFTCTLPSDEDAWAIENVATLPEFRRQGLVGRLLEHAANEARRDGAGRVHITFFVGNNAAEKAYAKAGFTFTDERRSPEFEAVCGSPGLRRYSREL